MPKGDVWYEFPGGPTGLRWLGKCPHRPILILGPRTGGSSTFLTFQGFSPGGGILPPGKASCGKIGKAAVCQLKSTRSPLGPLSLSPHRHPLLCAFGPAVGTVHRRVCSSAVGLAEMPTGSWLATMPAGPGASSRGSPGLCHLPHCVLGDLVQLLPCPTPPGQCAFLLDPVGRSHRPGARRNHGCVKEGPKAHHT